MSSWITMENDPATWPNGDDKENYIFRYKALKQSAVSHYYEDAFLVGRIDLGTVHTKYDYDYGKKTWRLTSLVPELEIRTAEGVFKIRPIAWSKLQ